MIAEDSLEKAQSLGFEGDLRKWHEAIKEAQPK